MSFLLPALILGCAPEIISENNDSGFADIEAQWNQDDVVPTRILVQRRDGIQENIRFRNQNLTLLRNFSTFDVQEIEVPEGVDYRELLEELWDSGEYTIAEPVLRRSIPQHTVMPFSGEGVRAPNDPFYQYQTNMDIVQATDATHSGSGIVVAVIDTGVGTGGTDTPINMLAGYDFVNDDNDPTDDQGHGTHVAGTVAQATNNGIGTIGVAPDVDIMPLKTLGADGTGFSSDTIAAMEYALNNGADVVNMSLGSTTGSTSEEAAVDALVAAGVAVVAATGNDGIQNNGVNFPAAYENSIAVSATGFAGTIATYSNGGSETDLAAPGGDMNLTDTNGDGSADQWTDENNDGQPDGIIQETISGSSYNFFFYEGTSMATPHVAGAIAALMSAGATAAEAESFLKSTAVDLGTAGVDNLYGHGEIRLQDAIDAYLDAQSSNGTSIDSIGSGDLFITEIMHNPNLVPDYRGEWIELYNNSGTDLNLNGLQIDNGSDAGITVSQDVVVPAGDYVVLGVFASSISNGGYTPDYVYPYSSLRLGSNTTLTLSNASSILDTVSYTFNTHDVTTGASLSVNSLTPADNDVAANWCASSTSYGDGDLGTPGSANDACPAPGTTLSGLSAGDLVISEVMVDPSAVSDYRGEWFEIYNNTADTVDLNGLVVSCGGNNGFTLTGSSLVAGGATALFSVRSNDGVNGGMTNVDVEYSYGDCSFNYTDSLSIGDGSTTFDSVSWTSSYPFSAGVSMTLGTLSATANDSASSWCAATNTYGDGDLGAPGTANDTCPSPGIDSSSLGTGDLVISEIMMNPTSVFDYKGEWFEVYNNSGLDINLNGITVSSSNNTGFTIADDIRLADGDYALFAVNFDPATNGGLTNIDVGYYYTDLSFWRYDDITLSVGGTTIDSVSITSAFPEGVGSALTLGTLSATANDNAANWCEATSSYGSENGTPGAANDTCP